MRNRFARRFVSTDFRSQGLADRIAFRLEEGVVRLPWSLAMISTRSFCQMPTHEYVVPRSMPITVSTLTSSFSCTPHARVRGWAGQHGPHRGSRAAGGRAIATGYTPLAPSPPGGGPSTSARAPASRALAKIASLYNIV